MAVLRAAAVGMVVLIGFYVANPLAAPAILLVFAVTNIILAGKPKHLSVAAIVLPALFIAWMAVSMTWAPETRPARRGIALYVFVVAATLVALAYQPNMSRNLKRWIAAALTVVMVLIAIVSLEESLSGHYFRRMIASYVPVTRARTIQLKADSGWIAVLQSYATQKSFAALTFMLWPALLASLHLARVPWQKTVRWATVAAIVIAVSLSDHASSKLALIVSAAAYLLARWSRSIAFMAIVAGWIAANLLVVPVTLGAYWKGTYKIERLHHSSRHRIVIWGQTSERILKAPLRGYGVAATRVVDETATLEEKGFLPGTNIPAGTNIHSHNIFLQTWHELGAIGALLLLLAGLPVLNWLRTRSDRTAPYVFAAFAAAVAMASVSWSLFAVWYIAAYGLLIVFTRFAELVATDVETDVEQERPPTPIPSA